MKQLIFVYVFLNIFQTTFAQDSLDATATREEKLVTYINDLSNYHQQFYFSNNRLKYFPQYTIVDSLGPLENKGFSAVIKSAYQREKYKEALDLVVNEGHDEAPLECFADIKEIFSISTHLLRYNYEYKTKEAFLKALKNNKCSDLQLYGMGNCYMFDHHNLELAAKCYMQLLTRNSDAYFRKQAFLFLGIIKKNQAVVSQNEILLSEALSLFDKAFQINETDFLSLGKKYLNKKQHNQIYGFYLYPAYYQLTQFAVLQEIADATLQKYQLSKNQKDLKLPFDYYFRMD